MSASSTQAGPDNKQAPSEDMVLAINEAFESFRVNYHNQFLKAYPDLETLNFAKRLWLSHVQEFDAQRIRMAAQQVIKQSDFLPSIHRFLKALNDPALFGLPSAYDAYIEACRAPTPKANFNWSHMAIYYAGAATDWFLMASQPEDKVFPVFQHNYQILCERVIKGEELEEPVQKALPKETATPMSAADNLKKLKSLRETLSL